MNILRRIIRKIRETHWKYMASGSDVRIQGTFQASPSASIKASKVYVDARSTLILHGHVRLEGIGLWVTNGATVEVGEYSFFERGRNAVTPEYIVNSGSLWVADHTKLACQRLWVRYGGNLKIGQYTNVNDGSEIRCDENIAIGSYCQLSYNLRIWDTNTHCIYPPEKRRQLTQDHFPCFGYEYEHPKTAPVAIGDGAWIGEKASILKGTTLGNNVIVGYNTTIVGKQIPKGKTVVKKIEIMLL